MATNAEKLVEAESAYHSLMIGASARVVVDQNGERVEYTAANASRLQAYITSLKNLIADEAGTFRVKGPLGVIF
jgi:hypothetical protein